MTLDFRKYSRAPLLNRFDFACVNINGDRAHNQIYRHNQPQLPLLAQQDSAKTFQWTAVDAYPRTYLQVRMRVGLQALGQGIANGFSLGLRQGQWHAAGAHQ